MFQALACYPLGWLENKNSVWQKCLRCQPLVSLHITANQDHLTKLVEKAAAEKIKEKLEPLLLMSPTRTVAGQLALFLEEILCLVLAKYFIHTLATARSKTTLNTCFSTKCLLPVSHILQHKSCLDKKKFTTRHNYIFVI